MKTIGKILGLVLSMMFLSQASQAQRLVIFSVDDSKNGQIVYSTSPIKDNYFDLNLNLAWVTSEMAPISDKKSVVGFDVSKLKISTPFVYLVEPSVANGLLIFNDRLVLKFEVDERFPGGEIRFEFPFFYSVSKEAALKPDQQKEFIFARPKNYVAINNVEVKKLIDKTPPKLLVVNPEGVSEGLKPIVESDKARITLTVSDFFGVSKVVVNNLPAQHLGDSTFVVDLNLRYGFETPVKVVAEDVNGLRTEKTFSIESRQPIQTASTNRPSQRDVAQPEEDIKQRTPSDIEVDIPNLGLRFPLRYALIIGNEDYSTYQRGLRNESDVEFAVQDAETFKTYATNILGIPSDNIIFLKNATSIEMHRSINKLNSLIRLAEGKAEVFVMYAGHGFPDEKSQEPYIMPVDVSGTDMEFAIKLSYLYQKLTEHPSKRVTVFLDACFSGGGREQGLVAARAVKVTPRQNMLTGNVVVFAATSGDQSALPWKDKQHGMFTYHLLNKLKETKGDITYDELSEYLRISVGTRSIIINNKEQNPQTNISPAVEKTWKGWKFR
jgi:hypothetical protein